MLSMTMPLSRCVFSFLALLLASLLAAACGDSTSSSGELGRLRYTLVTDYDVPQSELTEARIVARHEQTIQVSLTFKGRQDVEHPADIRHALTSTTGAEIETLTSGSEEPPGFEIRADNPGLYTVESKVGEELIDRIQLRFEAPVGFELICNLRAPGTSAFVPVQTDVGPIPCQEGSQITLDAAPLGADQNRLAGRIQTTIRYTPTWAAVPGVGVLAASEEHVWAASGQANFYFIEPALVTFTVTDPVTSASGDATFDVAAIPH